MLSAVEAPAPGPGAFAPDHEAPVGVPVEPTASGRFQTGNRFGDARRRPHLEGCTLATATATTRKLRPLGDRVVVRPTAREEMTQSGIVLPDTAKEKPQEGTVIAVGPGRTLDDGKREAIDVEEGQRVLDAKYAGTEFKVEGEELLIVSQKDILAIVNS